MNLGVPCPAVIHHVNFVDLGMHLPCGGLEIPGKLDSTFAWPAPRYSRRYRSVARYVEQSSSTKASRGTYASSFGNRSASLPGPGWRRRVDALPCSKEAEGFSRQGEAGEARAARHARPWVRIAGEEHLGHCSANAGLPPSSGRYGLAWASG